MIAMVMVGCATSSEGTAETDDAVKSCRSDAHAKCDALGFGTSTTCVLVFAKLCSAEDEEAARVECVTESGLAADAPCCLTWR